MGSCKRLHCAAGCSWVPSRTRLHCVPCMGLAGRAGALGMGAGTLSAMAACPLGVSHCLCLSACSRHGLPSDRLLWKLSHLPYCLAKLPRTACPHQTALALLHLRGHFLLVFDPCDGAVQRCEGGGTRGACEVVSPREEGTGPWSHPTSVSSFTSWLGSLGWWVCSASLGTTSLSSLLFFAKLLWVDACAKDNSFSVLPLKIRQLAVQAAKQTFLLCFHMVQDRAGNCSWSD